MVARPLMRSVSRMPGMTKIRPTCGLARMLRSVSVRRLPARSGMASSLSSRTWTKPGASPLGETSHWPSALAELMKSSGASATNWRQCSSRRSICFLMAGAPGVPMISRSSSAEVIGWRKVIDAIWYPLSFLFLLTARSFRQMIRSALRRSVHFRDHSHDGSNSAATSPVDVKVIQTSGEEAEKDERHRPIILGGRVDIVVADHLDEHPEPERDHRQAEEYGDHDGGNGLRHGYS